MLVALTKSCSVIEGRDQFKGAPILSARLFYAWASSRADADHGQT